jgi:hypothetical protein
MKGNQFLGTNVPFNGTAKAARSDINQSAKPVSIPVVITIGVRSACDGEFEELTAISKDRDFVHGFFLD